MLKIIFQNILNIIFANFLKKLLFKKKDYYFIDNAIIVLFIKFYIILSKTAN